MEESRKRKVFVIGVGMTKFVKPGNPGNPDYPEMARQAGLRALHDSGIDYKFVEQATCSYVYGDSCSGQRALYEIGLSGIPVFNVNNNCSSGSTGLYIGYNLITGGLHNCVMALGFEKMKKGSLKNQFEDRESPLEKFNQEVKANGVFDEKMPFAPMYFGNAGIEHMKNFGTKESHFAKIAYKNHLHSVNNPYSQFRDQYTIEQILSSPRVFGPLTKLQCCPTSDGAACVILASESFIKEHGLENQAVEILGMVMETDKPNTFNSKSMMDLVGYEMTGRAAQKLYRDTKIVPSQIQVCELHDCFSTNELITYEGLGLCAKGEAAAFVDSNQNTYGGRVVVNPSGGLISKGHPLGATGLAQCAELVWQLRGMAQKRQVPNAHLALQHNLGLGGAAVLAIYRKWNTSESRRKDQSADPEFLQSLENKGALRSQKPSDIPSLRSIYLQKL